MPEFQPSPGWLAPGRRVYAVGDVHGCAERLRQLHASIAADISSRPVRDAMLVHIGDYIDRGPDSAGVIELLARGPAVPAPTINLLGNHEDMMLGAVDTPFSPTVDLWLMNHGGDTLRGWGVDPDLPPEEWAALLPPHHMRFLRGLAVHHRIDGYLFVHAGIRPNRTLAAQDPHDLVWIREPFLSWTGDPGFVVVHGHTPVRAPAIRPNRIGIDTGAVMGGELTCAVLEEDRLGFLTA